MKLIVNKEKPLPNINSQPKNTLINQDVVNMMNAEAEKKKVEIVQQEVTKPSEVKPSEGKPEPSAIMVPEKPQPTTETKSIPAPVPEASTKPEVKKPAPVETKPEIKKPAPVETKPTLPAAKPAAVAPKSKPKPLPHD